MAGGWDDNDKKDFEKGATESGWNLGRLKKNWNDAFQPSKNPAPAAPSPSPERKELSRKIYESGQ